MLVPTLTVAENVALGLKSSKGALTDLGVVSKRIDELATEYGLEIDPSRVICWVWSGLGGEIVKSAATELTSKPVISSDAV